MFMQSKVALWLKSGNMGHENFIVDEFPSGCFPDMNINTTIY